MASSCVIGGTVFYLNRVGSTGSRLRYRQMENTGLSTHRYTRVIFDDSKTKHHAAQFVYSGLG